VRRIAVFGLVLAVLAALGAAGAGLGYRNEFWALGTGFTILRWSAYAGLAAAGLSLAAAAFLLRRQPPRGGLPAAVLGLVAGVAVAAVPFGHLRMARSVPPIHDITTDTRDPPQFVAILPLRAGAPNPAAYGGEAIARQQGKAYPDIRTAQLAVDPETAFTRAHEAARALGWEIVAAVPAEGRIEATDETFWFGFRDDVVVRIRRANGDSRVDVRSVSRVGRSDVGANARRIRRFLDVLGP
jgi:uncharacterized protein (DUF1499 family)